MATTAVEVTETVEEKSAAAGSKTFAGSDSRKYNYFEPKGRKASLYEDVTVDVQPDPSRYLIQDWIISVCRRHSYLFADAHSDQEFRLAQVSRARPGMGEEPLPAAERSSRR